MPLSAAAWQTHIEAEGEQPSLPQLPLVPMTLLVPRFWEIRVDTYRSVYFVDI